MSRKKKEAPQETLPENDETIPEGMVQLDLNKLLAAIVKNIGFVTVPMADVIADYSDKSISLTLDDETNMLVLSLINTADVQVEENVDES